MERLKSIKETLVSCVQGQLSHLDTVDTKELGEAVDMIKDLEEAIYYCTITKSMTEKDKEEHHHYYTEYLPSRDMDKRYGRMYYEEYPMYYDGMNYGRMYYNGNGNSGGNSSGNSSGGSSSNGGSGSNGNNARGYQERPFEMMRDRREGRSPMSRKTYMESKEMHHDKPTQMKELEKYLQELSTDVTELIADASPEEKQLMQQKITNLATKIK